MRVRFGRCLFDGDSRELRRDGVPQPLSPKAFQFLELLLQERPRALAKQEIHERLWPDSFVADSSLARLAAEVRSALGDDAKAPRLLRTIHRFGYAFSGDVVAEAAARGAPAACRLVWAERHIPLVEGENLLGRASDARIVIDLARVSRHHARVVVEGAKAVLEDLGSKNGTFLRGQPVKAAAELADGDEICIGPAVLVFRTSAGNSTTETGTVGMSGAPSLAPGARVGPYEVLALLGEGGMGQVYRARDERLSREVALKVVHADLAQDAERLRRFEHEAKAAGTLNHPNIVAVYDTGQHDGAPYIVSELLQGETLRDRMATGALGAAQGRGVRRPDRARPRGRARARHRPPRPQAREPVPDQGRARQDPRLRHREARTGGRGKGRDRRRDALPHRHEPRHDDGHGRLHVPRAGPRPADGPPLGPLLFRGRSLRDAHGQAGVQGHDRRRHAERDPARGPDRVDGQRSRAFRRACSASCAAVSRRAPRTASRPRAIWPSPSRAPRPGRAPRRLRPSRS